MKKFRRQVDTLLISDVHLWSEICQAELLLQTLKEFEFKRLIIVGDLVEDDHLSPESKLNWHQFQIVEYLRKICRKKEGVQIIRVGGNHDWSGRDFVNELLGVKSLREYRWKIGQKTFCAIHGHQWDRFISKNVIFSKIVARLFLFAQKFDTRRRHLARMLDRWHGRWFRLTEEVAKGAIKYAHRKRIDVIICGHTHELTHRVSKKGNHTVTYWNCGDWTGDVCSFLIMDEEGNIEGKVLDAYTQASLV